MFAEERHAKIADLLSKKSSIKVNELVSLFKISESTIRRDLQDMEERGLLTRTHGGAMGAQKTSFEPTFKEKEYEQHNEKTNIGKIAASMIKDGDTIILDSGTTIMEIARLITAKNVTVITNSIDVAAELSHKEHVELIITGGTLRTTTRAMVGHITETALKNFRVDKAFIGANGISLDEGLTTPNFIEAQTKKAMINAANKVIVVADSTKFNQVCFSVISPIGVVSTIITSDTLDIAIIKDYQDTGIEIVTNL